MGIRVDFALPDHLPGLLAEMDAFIDAEIKPLEAENMQYFDRRREFARTDLDNGGIPARAWEDLLDEMRRRADAAGWLRYGLPKQFGGRDGTNLDMAIIREHLAHKGLGLHNDLQDESSIVGNFPQVIMMDRFGTDEQKALWCDALITGERSMAFGLTEPNHGSDATWLETTAVADGEDWVINGSKRWNTGVHRATHDLIFARTSGVAGQARGITAFLVPTDAPGFTVPYYWWTFNMPTDHGEVELRDVRVPADAVLGEVDRGLEVGQTFLHENRIRQAASSLGAAQYCIDRAVKYASEREVFGKPLAVNQAVQWPLVELQTEAQMVRLLVYYAATHLDRPSPSAPHVRGNHMEVSDKVSMANYRANRLVCEAADRAMQVHGGVGYSRHEPFEHIYRHHRRYRITEGAEEIQIRRVAQRMFKFGSKT
jgi:acyl-CoA dehydrogenase